jgi:glycosyltransferase involved in cell wall biosynthesis
VMALKVSVIVPTHNRADLIGHTLDSILRQSHAPAEVIVVDDGSTDNTEIVVRRFGDRVKYLRIENSGECCARNAGVSVSSAPWVAFCDSDDLWHQEKLSRQVRLFEKAPDVQYSFTNFNTVTEEGISASSKFDSSPAGYWDLPRRQIEKDLFVLEAPMFSRLLSHQPIFPSTLMMKRSFFESVGRWNEPLGRVRSVDLEFHLRCVSRSNIGVVFSPVVGIRKHASNFSGDPLKNAIGEIAILRYVLENNPVAKDHSSTIREQIIIRSAQAVEVAFEANSFETMLNLLEAVPLNQRSCKLHLKALIAHCPRELGRFLRRTAMAKSAGPQQECLR